MRSFRVWHIIKAPKVLAIINTYNYVFQIFTLMIS